MNLIFVGAALVASLMFVLWLIHLRSGNAAIVDAGWAGGLAMLGVLYALFGDGYEGRRRLMGAMSAIWGVRLAIFLLVTRIIGHPEEGRYQELRRKWITNLPLKFLAFFQFQALTCVLLAIPFWLSATNRSEGITALEWSAVVLWIAAMLGEAIADGQLNRFKGNPANKGRTCQIGLWHYSRHPNYFFEWLIWLSYAVFAFGAPNGYIGMLSPALILYFILRVTGIPATEEQALRSRGDEYRRYQQSTSAFIPWFPKRTAPTRTA